MPLPSTSGQFRTKLEDMQVGDFIAYKAVGTSGIPCTISDIGAPLATAQANEIPVAGSAAQNGYAYALKVDTGVMISDRPVQHSVSWDALNTAKLIQGLASSVLVDVKIDSGAITVYTNGIPYSNTSVSKLLDGIVANDSSNNGLYVTNSPNPLYVSFKLSEPKRISKIRYCRYDTNYQPYTFTIEGSNNTTNGIDGTWSTLKSYSNYPAISTQWGELSMNSSSAYLAYRYNISTVDGGVDRQFLLNEIELYELISYTTLLIRSLTGGNAYLGTDGKSSLTDKGLGAFPSNNEWDKYIVGSNLGGKITAGDDNVWHHKSQPLYGCWVQDTINVNLAPSSNRVTRGSNWAGTARVLNGISDTPSSYAGEIGFRPVFQFLEPNAKASNLFY